MKAKDESEEVNEEEKSDPRRRNPEESTKTKRQGNANERVRDDNEDRESTGTKTTNGEENKWKQHGANRK